MKTVCERSARIWQQITSEKLRNVSLGPHRPCATADLMILYLVCDTSHKIWVVWKIKQKHFHGHTVKYFLIVFSWGGTMSHQHRKWSLCHVMYCTNHRWVLKKIIKSKAWIKHKDNSHAAWKLQLHTMKEIKKRKRKRGVLSENLFVLISLLIRAIFSFFQNNFWQVPDILLAWASNCILRLQWPQNDRRFPPLVWRAWLWHVTQRSSLIRLLFMGMMKYLSVFISASSTRWLHWDEKHQLFLTFGLLWCTVRL